MIKDPVDDDFESILYLPSVLQRKKFEACRSVVQKLYLCLVVERVKQFESRKIKGSMLKSN